jgi:DNA-binding GntR family transcriptional regulator
MTVRDRPESGAARTSRFDHAYQVLRDRIVQGTYGPDRRLTEMELARDLAVSRPTVRMALVRLEREGLVVTQPNRGASVRSISAREALQMLRVREVLDGLVAALAAEAATTAELQALAAIVGEIERVPAADWSRTYPPLFDRFQAVLLRAARDDLLVRHLASLNDLLVRCQYRAALVPGPREQVLAELHALVQALRDRDAARAEQAMRQYASGVRLALARSIGCDRPPIR